MVDYHMPDAAFARLQGDADCCGLFLKYFYQHCRDIGRAIGLTAEDMGLSAECVARTLVEMGLRTDPGHLPIAFVRRLYDRKSIPLWSVAALTRAQHALLDLWPAQDATMLPPATASRYGHLTLVHAA